MKLLLSGASNELSSLEISQDASHVSYLQMRRFETISIQVSSNGYVYAGGTWQVHWSDEKKRLQLQEICAAGIDLIEVATLFSDEEMKLVEQAIHCARDFWDKKIPGAILMFVCCEEILGDSIEMHRHPSQEDLFAWQQVEKTWRMVFHEFGTREKPHRTVVRTVLVRYHPDGEEDYFTVELA